MTIVDVIDYCGADLSTMWKERNLPVGLGQRQPLVWLPLSVYLAYVQPRGERAPGATG